MFWIAVYRQRGDQGGCAEHLWGGNSPDEVGAVRLVQQSITRDMN